MSNNYQKPDFFVTAIKDIIKTGECITVEGTGNSMLPFINPETDKIVLSPLPEKLYQGDICLYLRDGHPVIHRIYKINENSFDMLGDNQYWIEKDVKKSEIIAIVSKRIRNGEELDCLNPKLRKKNCRNMKKRIRKYYRKYKIHNLYAKIRAHI